MNIKTLTYIHELLKEEAEKTNGAYKYIRDIADTAAEEEKTNASFLKRQADNAWNKYMQATAALDDFENQDW